MCKRLEVEFEFNTFINGISGRFDGCKQYNVTRYEEVETLQTDVVKVMKNHSPMITFKTYDSSTFKDIPAYGRITNTLDENLATCLIWKDNKIKDKYQIDLCKKEIKAFIALMIDMYRDDLEK